MNRIKRTTILLGMLFVAFQLSSQIISIGNQADVERKTLDQGAIRVFYEATSVKNPSAPEKTGKDYMVLVVGEKGISRYYDDNIRRRDSIVNEVMKTGAANVNIGHVLQENRISMSGSPQEVFKNYPAGKMTVTDRIMTTDYLHEEELGEVVWEILPDTRDILSYTCQKARAAFRGREYEAWFAPTLPLNDGPWKFCGLPGLILSVKDSANHYTFEAIGIENYTQPVTFAERKYLKTSRKEVEKVKKRFTEDPMGFISNSMGASNVKVKVQDRQGRELSTSEVKLQYNPIELE